MQTAQDPRWIIPETMARKLAQFRRHLWRVKLTEAIAMAASAVLGGFLATFVLDRFFETHGVVRGLLLSAAAIAFAGIPRAVDRWIIRRRRPDQLARLLSQTDPETGDRLLGVIELASDADEQGRSPVLVQAAIKQVAEVIEHKDLTRAIPTPRHRHRSAMALMLAAATILVAIVASAAAANAWTRFINPWSTAPRYTFAMIQPLDERIVVPHGEPFRLGISLAEQTRWNPPTAEVSLASGITQDASLDGQAYSFELPSLIDPQVASIRVGDFRGQSVIEPMRRPELTSITATIQLPPYLGRQETLVKDVRGAALSVVVGSTLSIAATASRELANATADGANVTVMENRFATETKAIVESQDIRLTWTDKHGLAGYKPLHLSVVAIDDEPPTVTCEGLARQSVLLLGETLTFQTRARDDFGIKRVGIQWRRVDESTGLAYSGPSSKETEGELILGAGGVEVEWLDLLAAFAPKRLGVEPQTLSLRPFVQDYLPDRPRVFGTEAFVLVMSSDDHAAWVTGQLSRWQRTANDVRDREMQLFQTNRRLRDQITEQENSQDDRPEAEAQITTRIQRQADQERANGRRLEQVIQAGQPLLREAMRNEGIDADQLESWAEMLKTLGEISDNRMPSVADLLDAAAQKRAAKASENPSSSATNPMMVGTSRLEASGKNQPGPPEAEASPIPPSPKLVDVESSQRTDDSDPDSGDESGDDAKKPQPASGPPPLRLPTTKLAGPTGDPPAAEKADGQDEPDDLEADPLDPDELAEAIAKQQDLLDEFAKVAQELAAIMSRLEGSTLVKRLKSASRKQSAIADSLAASAADSFGVSLRAKENQAAVFSQLATAESNHSQDASNLMDDVEAYVARKSDPYFGRVLDEMRSSDLTGSLRDLSEDLMRESGLSIAQAQYWSDTLDRWAEDLVPPAPPASSEGAKAKPKDSMPPTIVLEVMRMLAGQMDLREQTRVAEQAKSAVAAEQHQSSAASLAQSQSELESRMQRVVMDIARLPQANKNFGNDLDMLSTAAGLMGESAAVLGRPDTGSESMAVQTEIIETMLKSERFNPSTGGGGAGEKPGEGSGGQTDAPALALVGSGINTDEVRGAPEGRPSGGTTGVALPEEFRTGLDRYFGALEQTE